MTAPRPRSTTSDLETKRAERKRHENFDRRCERCDRPSSGRCLRANQHEVFALTQSRDSAAVLKEIGAEPVIADALDAAAVKAAVGRRDAGFRSFRARLAWSASGQVAAPPPRECASTRIAGGFGSRRVDGGICRARRHLLTLGNHLKPMCDVQRGVGSFTHVRVPGRDTKPGPPKARDGCRR